jgi:hypothetical protein
MSGQYEAIAWERRLNGARMFVPTRRHYRAPGAERTLCGVTIPQKILNPPSSRHVGPLTLDTMTDREIAEQPLCSSCGTTLRRVMSQPTFLHLHTLDPDWQPGPGQKWRDAPKARMRVTKMTRLAVYYTYANAEPGARGAFSMTRETWDRDYAPNLDATLTP